MPTNSAAASAQPIRVFISCSREDEPLMLELRNHLSVLRHQGVIREDREVAPGEEWELRIADWMSQAHIILLLVSADYLASDYHYNTELPRALDRHASGEAFVIPVILRDCLWRDAPFAKLRPLPEGGRPVRDWPERDKAFKNIAEGIRAIVKRVGARPAPGLGEKAFLLCDRDDQEDAFDNFIRGRDARVLVCGIRAAARELPGSLAHRLTDVTLRDYARSRWSARDSVVTGKLITWPDAKDADSRQRFLISRIYRELGCEEREPTAKAFVRAFSTRLEKVIVLRHEVRDFWKRDEQALIESYLRFWDEVNALGPAPQFVIFLNLIYPGRLGRIGRSMLGGFDRPLQSLFAGESRLLLAELARIEEQHVKDWFARHGILDESDCLAHCAKLFKWWRRRRPMKEIEPALKKFHDEFLQRGG